MSSIFDMILMRPLSNAALDNYPYDPPIFCSFFVSKGCQ